MIGEKRINKTWHWDGDCWCWEVQEHCWSTGEYSKTGDSYWKNLTLEPFPTEEKAQQYLKSIGG